MTALGNLSTHRVLARATTGQQLDIGYDPRTNSILFEEHDWSVDVRGGATPRSVIREGIGRGKVAPLRPDRADG